MNTTLYESGELVSIVDETLVMVTKDMFYAKQIAPQVNTTVYIRCDIKQDDQCLVVTNITGDDASCEISWMDPAYKNYGEPYYYDQGPTDVDCPYEGIKDCKQYCNSTDDECAITDGEGYLIKGISMKDEINFTYTYVKDDVKVEDFVFFLCNETQTDVPADICPAPAPTSSSASIVKAACALVIAAVVVALF